jgi:hypothetical protein
VIPEKNMQATIKPRAEYVALADETLAPLVSKGLAEKVGEDGYRITALGFAVWRELARK